LPARGGAPMTPYRPRRVARAALAVLAATALVAACGDDDDTTTDDAADDAAPVAAVEVTGAWARTSPAVADAGAVYFEIANTGDADDALVGVSVDPAVAGKAELHETAAAEGDDGMDGDNGMGDAAGDNGMGDDNGMDDAAGDDGMGDDDGMGGGMMEMRPVDRIEVPAGDTVVLEP